jgi:hypothetical protein
VAIRPSHPFAAFEVSFDQPNGSSRRHPDQADDLANRLVAGTIFARQHDSMES